MKLTSLVAGFLLLASSGAFAQSITAVQPVSGYACMGLKISHDQAVDRTFSVPVFGQPSVDSPRIGNATIIPFIKQPFDQGARFQEMLTLDARRGWIETKWLQPFQVGRDPRATCSPWVMSNGRIGPKVGLN